MSILKKILIINGNFLYFKLKKTIMNPLDYEPVIIMQ